MGPVRHMHDVFSNWSRRAILHHLQARDEPVPVTTIVNQLLAWQRGPARPSEQDSAHIERLRSHLIAEHILEMHEFGLVEYDSTTDTVRIPDTVKITVTLDVGSSHTYQNCPMEPIESDVTM